MATITLDSNFDINALLAGSKKRGIYDPDVKAFLDSNTPVVEVDPNSPEYKGKTVATLTAGLKGAVRRLKVEDVIRVVVNDDRIFLINQQLV